MAKILVAFDTVDEGFEKIGAEHEVIRPPHGRDFTHEELCQLLPEADILCTSFDYPARAELLQYGSKLRLIANFGVGFNNIDIDYARTHGIVVTNTPQAVIIPTTELTLALMLDCARRVSELDRLIRQTPGKRPPSVAWATSACTLQARRWDSSATDVSLQPSLSALAPSA